MIEAVDNPIGILKNATVRPLRIVYAARISSLRKDEIIPIISIAHLVHTNRDELYKLKIN